MKVSVVIVTFNSKLEDIIRTLETVLCQDFCDYEIIISDDGSKENYFEYLRKYFCMKSFSNYVLVENKENQGTVRNVLEGLSRASGEYVKTFGPGDGFYDTKSLGVYYDFLNTNNYSFCFSYMQGYTRDKEKICKEFHGVPRDISAYQKDDEKLILKNLILYSDFVCGASMFSEASKYKEYLLKIKDYVKYCEDLFQVFAAIEGERFHLLPEYAIWYEMGTGVSSKKNTKYEGLLYKDTLNFYDKLIEQHEDNKYVKKRGKLDWLYKRFSNIYVKTLIRTLFNPEAILIVLKSFVQRVFRKDKINDKIGFFDQDEFNSKVDGITETLKDI